MKSEPRIVANLQEKLGAFNRERKADALLKAVLGVVFMAFTFGFVFWGGWFLGFFIGRSLGVESWQVGAVLTAVFLVIAIWSAWRQVNPLAGLGRLSDRQWMLTMLSQSSGSLLYFSPRHASAGLATILIGGPENLFRAIGLWRDQIRFTPELLDEAARLLLECREPLPLDGIHVPEAALLLRRLALVKTLPHDDSVALVLTDRGVSLANTGKPKSDKMKASAKMDQG